MGIKTTHWRIEKDCQKTMLFAITFQITVSTPYFIGNLRMNRRNVNYSGSVLRSAFALGAIGFIAATAPAGALGLTSEILGGGPSIGSADRDGTVYAGIATHKPFSAAAADEPGVYSWGDAKAHCESKGMELPTAEQLNHLYNHRAAIGAFNETGSNPYGKYWSSTTNPVNPDYARVQYFDDGLRTWHYKGFVNARVRCVRSRAP